MNSVEYATILLTMPLAQFKRIKKAVRVLINAGIYRDEALRIIMDQYLANQQKLYKVS